MRAGVVALLTLLVVTSGCGRSVLPSPGGEQTDLEDLPGIGEVDLEGARITVNATGCRETHMLVPANRSAVAEQLPEGMRLAHRDGNETRVAIVVNRCTGWTVNGTRLGVGDLVELSTPIQPPNGERGRHDLLLAVLAANPDLAARLAEAGLPARTAEAIGIEQMARYRIAEQRFVDVQDPRVPFEATVTTVSIEAELPFGTADSIGRERWVDTSNETLRVRAGLNVTELGGLSATLEARPGSHLAELLGNTTRSAFGFQAVHDARIGVLEVS